MYRNSLAVHPFAWSDRRPKGALNVQLRELSSPAAAMAYSCVCSLPATSPTFASF
ncbi:hypothetical protein K443DRAFT_676187 [Laccaria amethystina LaAM-08-1]|uniref:Unplaced genomic scaffold K443scaffold_37, whole genome shotgun sequence n=1 Tax=Laccaria amethystina LaAM-08-1 TaxID=1095629 RepID=A0A0C9XRA6_9AGAR|nr:hypothetical protein K443DRAFT_676187 [Laccaria amethystina LaAM-08-1]